MRNDPLFRKRNNALWLGQGLRQQSVEIALNPKHVRLVGDVPQRELFLQDLDHSILFVTDFGTKDRHHASFQFELHEAEAEPDKLISSQEYI